MLKEHDLPNLPIKMRRENLLDIPQHPMPEGFSMRFFRPGDEAAWIRINDTADIYNDIDMALFEHEFGYDIAAKRERTYFLCNQSGEKIGAATAWYNPDYHGMDYGRLHWVAILPEYQGRGLAKPMLTVVMNRLAEFHQRAYLSTSTARPVALKIYLDFGFVPEIVSGDDIERWRLVAEHLKHPALRDESLWRRW